MWLEVCSSGKIKLTLVAHCKHSKFLKNKIRIIFSCAISRADRLVFSVWFQNIIRFQKFQNQNMFQDIFVTGLLSADYLDTFLSPFISSSHSSSYSSSPYCFISLSFFNSLYLNQFITSSTNLK